MLKKEQIICIGFPTWEGKYMKSTVQLMKELAKDNEMLYVDYPFTIKDLFMNENAPVRRMLRLDNPLKTLTLENDREVNVLTLPPILPTNFIKNEGLYDRLSAIGGKQAKNAIKKAMKVLNFKNPIVINAFNPFLGVYLAGQLEEKKLFYYCYDEIGEAKWCGRHGGRLEKRLMKQADGVIFSSKPLMANKKHLAKKAFLVKNGVNFQLFSQPVFEEDTVPVLIKKPFQKVIGYLGSVDERLDYELLKHTITENPNHLFVFVGRINHEAGAALLSKFPNVQLIGPKPPAELPKWVNTFDVCLIPFVKNKLTAGIYPLKINEYLAVGKPVVTTNFSDLSDFIGVVKIANSLSAFQSAIQDSLNLNLPKFIHERVLFAYHNSWENRANQFRKILSVHNYALLK
ncbi:MAG: glycosyltransferase involved in cell wall biosynthesis [Paraglaciecola sp.]|jgi:glycosyltransferase involved in cell wall biosynthesis